MPVIFASSIMSFPVVIAQFFSVDYNTTVSYTHLDVYKRQDVIIVTTAKTDEEARELLTLFNMPFAK